MIAGKISVYMFIFLLLVDMSANVIAVNTTGSNQLMDQKILANNVKKILSNIFYMNMTRYRLDNVGIQDIVNGLEHYIISFKNNENQVIKLEVDVCADKILAITMDNIPPKQDVTLHVNPELKLVNEKAVLKGRTLRVLIKDLVGKLDRIYGDQVQPVINVLKYAEQKIPDRLSISKKWNGYKYTVRVNSEYSFLIDAVFMNGVNTPLGFSIEVWRSIKLPFNTSMDGGAFMICYALRNNTIYVNRLDVELFFINAIVETPEKLKHISYNTVINTVREALKKYLEKKGIRDYTIESIKPGWISRDLKYEDDHLVIIPGTQLTLGARVKIGFDTKSYLVQLNLSTMKASIYENYCYEKPVNQQDNPTDTQDQDNHSIYKWLAITTITLLLATIIPLYTYNLLKRSIKNN